MSKPSVLIVGGGAFGTSTAYHLSLRGYTSVHVLDRFDIPSPDAASTDLNKVIRADYANPMYTKLGLEALDVWKSPETCLAGLYRGTGWIMAGHDETLRWLDAAYKISYSLGLGETRWIENEEMKRRWPIFTGSLPGWKNLWRSEAGWVPSGQALVRMANEAIAGGVLYTTGDDGHVTKLLYDDRHTCVGALAASGKAYFADIVIVANGAALPTLLPDGKDEALATAGSVGIIQLLPHEVEKYRDMPVIDNFEQGLLFPPDEAGLVKVVANRSVTNYSASTMPGASVTHSVGDHPYDGISVEIEAEMREFLREITPELADRPWTTTRLCWDAKTKDLHFRVCRYPKARNLYIATCGTHHGFKFMPTIGRYVVDLLEGKLSQEHIDAWSWKNGQGPPGGVIDPHPAKYRDLGELTGWKNRHRELEPADRALTAML